jgi:chromosome segregation ATPase
MMAARFSDFAKRPGSIALIVVALLGWGLAIWSFSSQAQQSNALREQIRQLEASRAETLAEADTLRRSAGTAAALDQQVTTARADLNVLKKQQGQVSAELSRLREATEAAEQRHGQLRAEIQAQTERAAQFRASAESAAERLQHVQQDLATAQAALETRSRELNALSQSVESRRDELSRLERQQDNPDRRGGADGSVQTGSVSGRSSELRQLLPLKQDYRCEQDREGWTCSSGD